MARWQLQSQSLKLELELELKLELLGSAVSRWAIPGPMRCGADGRHSAELTAAHPMTSNVTVHLPAQSPCWQKADISKSVITSPEIPEIESPAARHPGAPRHPRTLAMPKDRGRSTSSGDKPAVIAGETSPQMRVGLQPKGGGGEEEPGEARFVSSSSDPGRRRRCRSG
jgi:hypothetical protein